MASFAYATLAVCWVLFVALFVRNWFRVQAHRKRHGETWEGRREDKPSRLGLYLQGALVLAFIPDGRPRPDWLLLAAAAMAVAATLLAFSALRHLGAQWRINTVVTADHVLVTTGPYAVVRHPVYTAIGLLGAATALLLTSRFWGIAALLVYAAGTEIRVLAEDALLGAHFGQAHQQWKARTKAWIPGLR